MTPSRSPRSWRGLATAASIALVGAMALSACALPTTRAPVQQTYRLLPAQVRSAALPRQVVVQLLGTRAAPGFESPAMMYSRRPDLLAPYRDSRWLAPPARLIDDAIARTLGRQPWVDAVQRQFTLVKPEFTLQCALDRLEHDVAATGGTVRLDLSCKLVDDARRRIAAHWSFDGAQPVPVNDAAHFAQAAQALLDRALAELVESVRGAVARSEAASAAPAAAS